MFRKLIVLAITSGLAAKLYRSYAAKVRSSHAPDASASVPAERTTDARVRDL